MMDQGSRGQRRHCGGHMHARSREPSSAIELAMASPWRCHAYCICIVTVRSELCYSAGAATMQRTDDGIVGTVNSLDLLINENWDWMRGSRGGRETYGPCFGSSRVTERSSTVVRGHRAVPPVHRRPRFAPARETARASHCGVAHDAVSETCYSAPALSRPSQVFSLSLHHLEYLHIYMKY
jgi:hypothetical protein